MPNTAADAAAKAYVQIYALLDYFCSKLSFRIRALKDYYSYHSFVVNKYHGSGNEASEVAIYAIGFAQLQTFVKM